MSGPSALSVSLWRSERMVDQVRYAAVALILLFGGASRNDALTQPVVQIVALLACLYMALARPGSIGRLGSVAWLPVLGIAALCAIQLIPLPPFLWQALPGRELYAAVDSAAGLDQWRPLTIHPAATLAALLGMLVPLAALMLFADASARTLRNTLILVLAIALFSALWGMMQAGSGSGALYPYRITNQGAAVGLFANRNHQAVFLSLVPPIMACLALDYREQRQSMRWIAAVGSVVALFVAIVIMFNGSRLGAGLFLGGLLAAIALFVMHRPRNERVADPLEKPAVRNRLLGGGAALVAVVSGLLWWFGSRFESLARIAETDLESEGRLRLIPYIVETIQAFMPVGAGVGSFDRAYRIYEPYEELTLAYLNHAHNDALEILVEGGLVAALLALISFWLIARAGWRNWQDGRTVYAGSAALARLGAILIALLLLGGVTDYPLRTPALAFLAALALVMLGRSATSGEGPKSQTMTASG